MNHLRLALVRTFCLVSLLIAAPAQAETIAATYNAQGLVSFGGPPYARATRELSCAALNAANGKSGYSIQYIGAFCGGSATCWDSSGGTLYGGCMEYTGTYSCPTGQNWTLSGSTCTRPDCAAGEARNPANGLCVAACSLKANQVASGPAYYSLGSNRDASIATGCFQGCQAFFSGTSPAGSALVAGVQTYYARGTYDWPASPSACTAASPTAGSVPSSTCGAGQVGGTVNGKFVCVNSATNAVAATNDPISQTTTTTTSAVTNPDTTVTTTTTKTNPDGTQSLTVVTTDSAGKPLSSSETKPAEKTECELHPERIGCKELGTPTEEGAITTQNIGPLTLTPVALASNATCPADVTLPHGQTFTWQPMCGYASNLAPILLALAWLMAGYIVIGAGKNG